MERRIRIGLIDDEPLALTRLEGFIDGIPGYEVVFMETDPVAGLHKALREMCDVLITDIQMGQINGLLICEQMEEIGMPVIICSAHEEYALQSIEVSVSGYLVKPVKILTLKQTLEKVTKKMDGYLQRKKEAQKHFLLVEDPDRFGLTRVLFSDIHYIEQRDNYSHFITSKGEIIQRSTLTFVESSINYPNLIRIHRSYIVNVELVEKILAKEVILENGVTLSLGPNYKDRLLNTFMIRVSR
ncbi:MAG: LytR/AlgR family response regulator transcription factor [Algoriphagus aquaeductus]|uniref:LytR/AlgR family response regulator transcription factor n=1 Tax=Algoriphagus aquaeductus TaxID=475299 RepID=UPI00387A564D